MLNAILFLIAGIPEMMGSLAMSLALAHVPLRWGRIALVGSFISLTIFIIRDIYGLVGFHLLAVILLMFIFLIMTTRVSTSLGFLVVFISVAVVALVELAVQEPFLYLSGMQTEQVIQNQTIWTMLGITQGLIMIFLACIVRKLSRPKKDMWKR